MVSMALTPLEPAPRLALPPNWTETYWDVVAAVATRLSPKGLQLGLRGLRRAFPHAAPLEEARHPIVALQLTHAGRAYLLELGLAITVLPATEDDIERLRDPEQFQGRATELIAGFMFRRGRVQLSRPPEVPGQRLCDFLADFPTGERFAIEAKHLELSDRAHDIEPVFCSLVVQMPTHFHWLSDVVQGARATFRFSDAICDLGNRLAVDFQQIRQRADAASAQLQAALSGREPFGTFELTGLGHIVIRPDPDAPGVAFDAFAPSSDTGLDNRRVRRVANRAMRQIREAGLPGVIVLDVKLDGLAWNALPSLRRWAAGQQGLVAVLALERHGFGGGSCSAVEVLPGREFEPASDSLLALLDICDAGHFHYAPLNDLMSPCPLAAWMS